jgi:hypothetical protein
MLLAADATGIGGGGELLFSIAVDDATTPPMAASEPAKASGDADR